MAPKRKGYHSVPKVFHCSGHGDCRMVFTRSEHLARHIRKHTGEKPFKCIIPGCNRMFTRFDNMMQHTRTHERQKKTSSVGSATARSTAPAVSRTASVTSPIDSSYRTAVPPMTIVSSPPPPPSTYDNGNTSMLQSRTLPIPPVPPKASWEQHHSYHPFAPPTTSFSPLPQQWQLQQQQMQKQYYPQQQNPSRATTTTPILSPPQSYTPPLRSMDFYAPKCRSFSVDDSSDRPISLTNDSAERCILLPNDEPKKRRRLSMIDLQTPIGHWSEHTKDEESDDSSTIEVTTDEYEAILGFGRFLTEYSRKPASTTVAINSPDLQVPTLCPVQGSFQRFTS